MGKIIPLLINNIGICYAFQNNYDEAFKRASEAFMIYQNVYRSNHPSVAMALQNLGYCYYKLGDYTSIEYIHPSALDPENSFTRTPSGNCRNGTSDREMPKIYKVFHFIVRTLNT